MNKYDPSLESVAARDHMTHVMYHYMQPQGIFDRSPVELILKSARKSAINNVYKLGTNSRETNRRLNTK